MIKIEEFGSVKSVVIFSNNSEEIRKYTIMDIDRGCTVFDGRSGYTGDKSTIIYSVMDRT
jgi:uncharacterized membrane-anchored protein YitT (DUF2179 family)